MVGRQLLRPRIGSIAEDEVAGLIRNLAFVNRPMAPDDIGADFVCSIARKVMAGKNPEKPVPMLYSGNWFLLSIKSGKAEIGLDRESGHFEWFLELEIPLLVVQVEPDDELRITVYHTLQHIACIKNIPEEIDKIQFRCEAHPKYEANHIFMDRSDVLELKGDTAIAWLGPPLLDLTRATLRTDDIATVAVDLLTEICRYHPKIRRLGHAGEDAFIQLITNKSISIPTKSYDVVALVNSTSDVMDEVRDALSMICTGDASDKMKLLWEHSQYLFGLYDSVRREQEKGSFTDHSPSLLRYQNPDLYVKKK